MKWGSPFDPNAEAIWVHATLEGMPYISSVERIGIEKGIAQGQYRLLIRQIRTRFGADCAVEAEGILGRVHEPAHLDRAGEWIVECETGAELLRRLQTLDGSDR